MRAFAIINPIAGGGRALKTWPRVRARLLGAGWQVEEATAQHRGHEVELAADNWAVYSRDGSLAAHFEHTVAVTREGPLVLTPWDDQAPQWLAFTRRDAEAIQPARVSAQAQRE
uniref:M24 family metallopeptidase n=1 Tax=Thermorudis sp. TaxID=1969470 RepID=A0A7C3A8U3_9BACT